ncbi:MAG: DUF4214 domain-containing protein [Pirellulales bacterium]
MLGRILVPAILVLAWIPLFAHAQIADSSTYVRQIHQQYVGREPSSYELQYWVDQLNRGLSPREFQAFIISSEAYFDRNQRSASQWIRSALTQVTRRPPTADESRYWTDRFFILNQNRLMWAREVIRWANVDPLGPNNGNLVSTGNSSGNSNPGNTGAGQGVSSNDLPGRLVSTAQLLSQAVTTEVTGNSHWLIQLQANSLLTTATTSRDVLSKAGASTRDAATALEYLEQSLNTVQTSLNQLNYTTPSSQHYAMQAADILAELKRMYPGSATSVLPLPSTSSPVAPVPRDTLRPLSPPPSLTPVAPVSLESPGYSSAAPSGDLNRSIADLQQACRQLVLLVRSRNSRESTYDRLLRDCELLSASVGLFRNNLQYGYSPDEQRKHAQELQRQSGTIERDMQAIAYDAQLSQMWRDTAATLSVVVADVGLNSSSYATPIPTSSQAAVPLRRPTFNGLPYSLPPPPATSSISNETIQTLDQAISQCDALMSTLGLYGYYTPGVAQLIGELRAERNELTNLRRLAAQVPPPSLQNALRSVNDQHRRVTTSWSNLANSGSSRSIPRLNDLNNAIDRVNQALSWLP